MSDAHWPRPMKFNWCDRCEMPVINRGLCWECRDREKALESPEPAKEAAGDLLDPE